MGINWENAYILSMMISVCNHDSPQLEGATCVDKATYGTMLKCKPLGEKIDFTKLGLAVSY